jgi:uncharacterized MAPEG superfamily protein
MSEELWIAVFAALLGIVHLALAAGLPLTQAGYARWNAGPRDEPFALEPKLARLNRAFNNFLETYVFFAIIAVTITILVRSTGVSVWGARLYLIARIVYIPCYVFALTGWRSLVWLTSLTGILMCASALLF